MGRTALNRGHAVGRVCYPTYGWRIANPPYIWEHNDYSIDVLGATTVNCGATATCDSPENSAFREDIRRWAEVSDRLWVWDYVACFTNYLLPFPNLRVLGENIRFFIRHGVTGIFEEGNYQSPHGEFSSLRGYVLAKLLWGPDHDLDQAVGEFLEGVFGAAAGPIRRYIDLLHDKVERENIHLHISEQPDAPYLTDEILAVSEKLWDEAEAAVAGQAEILEQVRIARLSLDWIVLERSKEHSPVFRQRAERFFARAEATGVMMISEWRDESLADYKERITRPLAKVRQ